MQVRPPQEEKLSRTHRSQELNLLLSLSPFRHPSPRLARRSTGKHKILLIILPRFRRLRPSLSPRTKSSVFSGGRTPLWVFLSVLVCGCAGGPHESCDSPRLVRGSDQKGETLQILSAPNRRGVTYRAGRGRYLAANQQDPHPAVPLC